MKSPFKTLVIAGIVAIAAILYTVASHRDGIRFIEDANDGLDGIDKVLTSNDSMSLRYSNEYRSWKNTTDTTFHSLYNGNQQTDVLAERPRMVILWAGYAFAKDYKTPRGHMYAIEDVYKTLRTGAPMDKTDGPQPAACWACKSPDIPRLLTHTDGKTLYKKNGPDWGAKSSIRSVVPTAMSRRA